MHKQFPKYDDHADAVCFKCEAALEPINICTEHAPGHGEWRAECKRCEMFTWYDLRAAQ